VPARLHAYDLEYKFCHGRFSCAFSAALPSFSLLLWTYIVLSYRVTSIFLWRILPLFSFLQNVKHCRLQNRLWLCVLYYESGGKALLTAAGNGYSCRKRNVLNVRSNKRR
jgi:hypothetical protein